VDDRAVPVAHALIYPRPRAFASTRVIIDWAE